MQPTIIITTEEQLEAIITRVLQENQPKPQEAEFITKNDAATLLNCSLGTINNRISDGTLKAHKNGRSVRLKKSDVLAILDPLT